MARKTTYCKTKTEMALWTLYGAIIFPILIALILIFILPIILVSILSGIYCILKGIRDNETFQDWNDFDTQLRRNIDIKFFKFLLSFWTNTQEPMPAGGEKDRWKDKSNLMRYILWHIRNPMADLKNFYLGFYNKRFNYTQKIIYKYGVYSSNNFYLEYIIKDVPRRIFRFPYLKILYGQWTFAIGWKRRGTGSIELNSDRN